MTRFRVLAADPPWKFSDRLPGKGRGAARHYRLLSTVDLASFPLPPLAEDCYLFLWRVSAMVEESYTVVRAWGFTPKSEIVWRKLTANGKPWFGMGRHIRAAHETCIVAVRGRPKPLVRNVRSIFRAKVGEHSAKPDEFYGLVEQLCAGPRVELFARRRREGWTSYGDQLEGSK